MNPYVKRLIEVDLPIKTISAHARKDKRIRKGHLHKMHLWWATRPLASCRAVILASILPAPADPSCPAGFRTAAQDLLRPFTGRNLTDPAILQQSLLDFVAHFSAWDAGIDQAYVSTARKLVAAAHPDSSPLVLDPFAGAGSIPFEALRVGAQSYAGELNPAAVLLNVVSQEYLPKYGLRLAKEVARWGKWVLDRAGSQLEPYYPADDEGRAPFAHVWARTIRCEGPGCGAEVPLLGMLRLSRRGDSRAVLRYSADRQNKSVKVELITHASVEALQPGIVKRFSVTCPVCQYTTPYKRVRRQIRSRRGGTQDARLVAVCFIDAAGKRTWREAEKSDLEIVDQASHHLRQLDSEDANGMRWIPDEPYPTWYSGVFNPGLWGISTWGDMFTPRQLLSLITMSRLVTSAREHLQLESGDARFAAAMATCLALAVGKTAAYNTATCYLHPDFGLKTAYLGAGMAMVPDFAEMNPLIPEYAGGLDYSIRGVLDFFQRESRVSRRCGTVQQGSATRIPLPDDSVAYLVTDPPYYAAVPYSDLSDLFYVWLRRALPGIHSELLADSLTPKDEELIAYYRQPTERPMKDSEFFETRMQEALTDARRVLQPGGVAVVIFAHKGTAGWEALLNALVNAGWIVTAAWPIDTENRQRWRAAGAATLNSSVHLVCRPRENPDGSLQTSLVGEWRDVLGELPNRIHDWMPRLAREGVMGADAIFACIGPALEIYSRYSRVERTDGTIVPLGDVLDSVGNVVERGYLSHVWEAVSREALSMIFEEADTAGFEADARLTAMWLWTLATADRSDRKENSKVLKSEGYSLEYDAARKIAQGLGAHLDQMGGLVEIKGDNARLLPVTERAQALFGKQGTATSRVRKPASLQMSLFEVETEDGTAIVGDLGAPPQGATVLDRVHQAMLLFAAGRSEALRRFLVDEGVGYEARFWKLAQALSALYPADMDEKRWVDGVLARKKGLGL